MISKYNLYIECKSCREGKHQDCKNNHSADDVVHLVCTCKYCSKKSEFMFSE
jgi:hypothetical protein